MQSTGSTPGGGNQDYDFLFKMLLIGNSGVGKSCLLLRYAQNSFDENFFNTIGVDFKLKTVKMDDEVIKLQIWDTAGQERFRNLTASYYRGAQGIIIVYDVTDQESFESVTNWMKEIEKYAAPNVCKILVGNKNDKEDREVSTSDGQELANQYQMPFLETSAKSATGVQEAFETMTKEIKKKYGQVKAGGNTVGGTGAGKSVAFPVSSGHMEGVDQRAAVNLANIQKTEKKNKGACC